MALDGETGCDPLGEAVLEACCIEAVPGQESDCVVGVHAVRTAAVGHNLSTVGDLSETRLQVADRDPFSGNLRDLADDYRTRAASRHFRPGRGF